MDKRTVRRKDIFLFCIIGKDMFSLFKNITSQKSTKIICNFLTAKRDRLLYIPAIRFSHITGRPYISHIFSSYSINLALMYSVHSKITLRKITPSVD